MFNVIECFCGAGGFAHGYSKADFQTVYAFDNDKKSIDTYTQNIDQNAFVHDAYEVNKLLIEESIGHNLPTIHVVSGGPPCQGFSIQRRGDDDDIRNHLVFEFLRIVLEIKPHFFVMENVGGLLSKRGKDFLDKVKNDCQEQGYCLHIQKLNAFDFGVPQNRKRVFIVGELTNEKNGSFKFPTLIDNREIYPSTVREAISDLMDKEEKEVPNHKSDNLSEINLKRIRSITQGQGRDSLPEELQLPCHKNNKSHRHLDVYGRMAWDNPSPTITARFDSFSRGRFGHPVKDRSITLREGARLQSFPDDFVFVGTKVEVARQIGNAVPPRLAYAVAKQIKACLSEKLI